MVFSWTPHRFSGGALALDVANSVIFRFDPTRSLDRFADVEQIDLFADAATTLCAGRAEFPTLRPTAPHNRPLLISLREATDGYFRTRVLGFDSNDLLADLLETATAALRNSSSPNALEAATARSALALAFGPERDRIKICGNCGWLFVDRSKNRSRLWCDMAVCGNRIKANRHYRRKQQELAG
jgi:predicted RNA-binding Zn ribbon-like protein